MQTGTDRGQNASERRHRVERTPPRAPHLEPHPKRKKEILKSSFECFVSGIK